MSGNDATSYSRRLDQSIAQYNYVAVVGEDNYSTTSQPYLFAQTYNTITVGLTSGAHSRGTTTLNGTGRIKPDIVAPSTATSWATPMVGSAAAMLLQTAKPISSNAEDSRTIKAVLMAGATKSEFSSWSHDHDSPLDSVYGAGELNVYRSYKILTGGEQEAGAASSLRATGWDFANVSSTTGERLYYFNVASGTSLSELSAVLAWNASGSSTTPLANLDLTLYSIIGGNKRVFDYSNSTVDNVELLYDTNLSAGSYAFGVKTADSAAAYSLAWTMTSVPEPGVLVLLLSGGSVAWLFLRRRASGSGR